MREPGRPHVHVMAETAGYARPNACAALRLLDPYSHPVMTEQFKVTMGDTLPDRLPEVVVMQRSGRVRDDDSATDYLVRSLKATDTRLIYDIDDNLLATHSSPVMERIIAPQRCRVQMLLRAADHTVVSTPALAKSLRRLTRQVTVWQNALDERRLSALPAMHVSTGPLRIGYFGSVTHLRDLMTVVGPVRSALSRLKPRPTMVLCGVSTDPRILSLFSDHADVETAPVTDHYSDFMDIMLNQTRWNIGLAPLAVGDFEAAKSDIKFLEYAAFGIPALYSNHPAYAAVQHGISGLVGMADQWADNLVALADNPDLRIRLVEASRHYLLSRRTLANTANALADVVHYVLKEPR